MTTWLYCSSIRKILSLGVIQRHDTNLVAWINDIMERYKSCENNDIVRLINNIIVLNIHYITSWSCLHNSLILRSLGGGGDLVRKDRCLWI